MRLQSFTGPERCLLLGKRLHVPFKDLGAAIPHLPRHLSFVCLCSPLGVSDIYFASGRFSQACGVLFLACVKRMRFLNKLPVYKYNMLVTFHAIWYVITELSTPAWQKDVRYITFDVIQAMEEAKKRIAKLNNQSVKFKYSSRLCKQG